MNNEQFEVLCQEFAEKVVVDESGKSPEMVAYIAEIVRTTVAWHMWRLLDEVEKEFGQAGAK